MITRLLIINCTIITTRNTYAIFQKFPAQFSNRHYSKNQRGKTIPIQRANEITINQSLSPCIRLERLKFNYPSAGASNETNRSISARQSVNQIQRGRSVLSWATQINQRHSARLFSLSPEPKISPYLLITAKPSDSPQLRTLHAPARGNTLCPLQHHWGARPRDTGAHACSTAINVAPPPRSVWITRGSPSATMFIGPSALFESLQGETAYISPARARFGKQTAGAWINARCARCFYAVRELFFPQRRVSFVVRVSLWAAEISRRR